MSIKNQTLRLLSAPVYLDCAATSPMEPAVRETVVRFMEEDFGNAGSRTHEYGARAKQAVQHARDQIAALVRCKREEVVFTSGATESNNLAILGLAGFGESSGRRHIISTEIEHKAVLEPLEQMALRGFEVELIAPTQGGWVDPQRIEAALRPDTLLVSVMHANNETGVLQPIDEIGSLLKSHAAYFHVDAAQTFGKVLDALRNPRVDLISASAHKLYGPKGVGALITRRRGFDRVPLRPLMYGGGQERGLRPGTLPVHLIAGFGEAAAIALRDHAKRADAMHRFREKMLAELARLLPKIHGDPDRCLQHVINLSFSGLNSETVMVALKDLIAISNGSACTSANYTLSHVLKAMGLHDDDILSALRISWCHLTPDVEWEQVEQRIRMLL